VSYTCSQRVDLALMAFAPATYFPKYLHSIDDVALHRARMRAVPYSEFAVAYLTDLVWHRVHESRRRNLIHGLNAIKWTIRNRDAVAEPIPATTVDLLFELYQHFIFDHLEDIRWCVSSILKDQLLRSGQIRWLLSRHQDSLHIVNRLLRYPKYHPVIATWARGVLEASGLEERRSELLGRLIVDAVPPEADGISTPNVLWAIYYSSSDPKTKQRLLESLASVDDVDELIEICLRLRLPETLLRLRDRLRGE
jgi:hypothetical protein